VFNLLSTTPRSCMKLAVYIHENLTSAVVGGEWSAARPGSFTSWERASEPLDRNPFGLKSRPGICVGKNSLALPSIELLTLVVKPTDSRYRDCATVAPS
jgi:hypothetical protein